MSFIEKVIPPETEYVDAILTYWKVLVLDLLVRYQKAYMVYKRKKSESIDKTGINALEKELFELKNEMASIMQSITSALAPLVLRVYFYQKKKYEQFPDEIKRFIEEWIIGSETEKKFYEYTKKIELNETLQWIKSLGYILALLGIIPGVEDKIKVR